MGEKRQLALLFGGQSCEHAVSVISARSILSALNPDKYQVSLIGISEQGRWRYAVGGDFESLIEDGKVSDEAGIQITPVLGHAGRFMAVDNPGTTIPTIDIVFPVLHGTFGEDGAIQGLLELTGIAYVGCPVEASANGMDKVLAKKLFANAGIPQAEHFLIVQQQWAVDPNTLLEQAIDQLGFPLFIKPAGLGSSVGISKAHNTDELAAAIELAIQFDVKVLIEKSFEDCAEIECAVLGNDHPQASMVGEIVAGAQFYDYDAKYISDSAEVFIPADLPEHATMRVQELAVLAFKSIQGQGLARVDFFVSRATGEVWLNEINTMPGFTPISMYPKLWAASGLRYAELTDKLVELADERHFIKKNLKRSY